MGVLLPLIDRWYFSAALEGMDRELRAAGYDLMVFSLGGTGQNRERVFNRSMLRRRIDALVVLGMALPPDEQELLSTLEFPSIVVGGQVDGMRHVSIDDGAAVREAVEHLIGLGHRKIGHLHGGEPYGLQFAVPGVRERAFAHTLAAHGIAQRPEFLADGDFRMGAAKVAAGRLLDRPDRPTAIFASSDEMAFGVLAAAGKRGLAVPGNLSVVGIDDHEFAEPLGLTTVRQSPEDQGAYAARELLQQLAGVIVSAESAPQPHQLVIRTSTAAAP